MSLSSSVREFLAQPKEDKIPLISDILYTRDLVGFAGKRRHGKTTFITNLCLALAVPFPEFLGFPITEPHRSMVFFLEDDAGEIADKLTRLTEGLNLEDDRFRLVTRRKLKSLKCPIDVRDPRFRQAVWEEIREHNPEVVCFDNLAHLISGDYNDAKTIHHVFSLIEDIADKTQAAIIIPAHPKKEDPNFRIVIDGTTPVDLIFEQIMGSSHFINSMESLWTIQRKDNADESTFYGGRQRAAGQTFYRLYDLDEKGIINVLANSPDATRFCFNSPTRQLAWRRLPAIFRFSEGHSLISDLMRSKATYSHWLKELASHKFVKKQEADSYVKLSDPKMPSLI